MTINFDILSDGSYDCLKGSYPMQREFIYTDEFVKLKDQYKFSGMDERELEKTILNNPKVGEVIQGTGGLRKLRFSKEKSDKGKSGSFRIFYLDLEQRNYIVLMAILKKNEEENLSKADRNFLKSRINDMKKFY